MHAYIAQVNKYQKFVKQKKHRKKKLKLAYCDIHLCYSKEEKGTVGGIAKETKLYTLFRIVELVGCTTDRTEQCILVVL